VPDEPLMATATRLGSSLEALAALAAHLRVEGEALDADPRVRDLLRAITHELLGRDADPAGAEVTTIVGMTRTLLAQSAELVDDPARAPGWEHVDPQILQGTGKMSMAIAGAIGAAAGRDLGGLAERLARPGAAMLDVGTGTAWLAIALAQANPALRVVGIDLFEPSLELARRNVEAAGLTGRVELRAQDVGQLDDDAVYDAVWLPMPFLPKEIVPQAMATSVRALRPGGWLLPGVYAGPPDPLSQLLFDLRTVRSGGHPWHADELIAEIASHGLEDAREAERTWSGPVRLFAGRRPLGR
jgi:2-polyprenyl-3-methyl-5-hydroxy-6-metoxy-1,4-benzoquinol methylase